MTKQDLIGVLSHSTDLANSTKAEASRIVELMIATITNELVAGNDVNISGLCKFTVKNQAEKTGKIPGTDKVYITPAKRAVRIKATKPLRDAVL